MHVSCILFVPSPCDFFRPLIGQHRSHDHFLGLSLVTALGVKIGCINTTIFVLEHSILTLGALLTYSLANTSHIITSQASHCIGATIRIGREILCLLYAGFFSKSFTWQVLTKPCGLEVDWSSFPSWLQLSEKEAKFLHSHLLLDSI